MSDIYGLLILGRILELYSLKAETQMLAGIRQSGPGDLQECARIIGHLGGRPVQQTGSCHGGYNQNPPKGLANVGTGVFSHISLLSLA
jgi:hypothetical protein